MLSRYTLCIVLTFVVVTSQHHCVCCRCIWYVADAYEVVSFSSTRPVHGKVPLVFEPCNMQGPSLSQKHVLVLHSMHAHRCIAAGKQPVNPAGQLMKKCTRVPLKSVCNRPSFIFFQSPPVTQLLPITTMTQLVMLGALQYSPPITPVATMIWYSCTAHSSGIGEVNTYALPATFSVSQTGHGLSNTPARYGKGTANSR